MIRNQYILIYREDDKRSPQSHVFYDKQKAYTQAERLTKLGYTATVIDVSKLLDNFVVETLRNADSSQK